MPVPTSVLSALTTSDAHAREAQRAALLCRALLRARNVPAAADVCAGLVESVRRAGAWLVSRDTPWPTVAPVERNAERQRTDGGRAAQRVYDLATDLHALCAGEWHDEARVVWGELARAAVELEEATAAPVTSIARAAK